MMEKIKVYLASPYGFTSAGREFMNKMTVPVLKKIGFDVLNPWDSLEKMQEQFERIYLIKNYQERIRILKSVNNEIAQSNEKLIDQAEILIAVLDGPDVDSGVAAEIGYAYSKKKRIIGYRSDFRVSGDNAATIVNLQIEYFINRSGGTIVKTLEELEVLLKEFQSIITSAA